MLAGGGFEFRFLTVQHELLFNQRPTGGVELLHIKCADSASWVRQPSYFASSISQLRRMPCHSQRGKFLEDLLLGLTSFSSKVIISFKKSLYIKSLLCSIIIGRYQKLVGLIILLGLLEISRLHSLSVLLVGTPQINVSIRALNLLLPLRTVVSENLYCLLAIVLTILLVEGVVGRLGVLKELRPFVLDFYSG
jgi:hypothetical protein